MTRAFVVFSEKMGLKRPMGILQNQTSGFLQLILYKRHGKVVGDTLFFERFTQGVTEEAHALGYDLSVRYFYGSQPTDEQICAIQSEPSPAKKVPETLREALVPEVLVRESVLDRRNPPDRSTCW